MRVREKRSRAACSCCKGDESHINSNMTLHVMEGIPHCFIAVNVLHVQRVKTLNSEP